MIFSDSTNRVVIDGNSSFLASTLTEEQLALVEPYTPTPAELNAPILAQLATLDAKSVRALRENDVARIATIEAEAATLRAQLV